MSIRKVMIEDGDAFMRMCTKKLLVENGFEVAEATNGIVAIWESEPDMLLMDTTEPDKASQAARREIKNSNPSSNESLNPELWMQEQFLRTMQQVLR